MITLLLLLVAMAVPILLGWLLSLRRPEWTRRRIVLTAALPVPSAFAVLVTGISASFVWTDEWGLILAAVQTVPGLAFATLLFGIGLGLAALGARLARSRNPKSKHFNEIFE